MAKQLEELVDKALELGALEAKILDTAAVVFDPRSFLKCRFGCNRWGRYWTCPPNLDISPETFQEAFDKYKKAIIIQSTDPKKGQEVTVALEKEAMMAYNCMHALALVMCVWCEECSYPEPCRFPHMARPSMDAYGIDIGKTIETVGLNVSFDENGKMLPCWYSMVLLD